MIEQEQKRIIIEPNQPIQTTGQWTVGEILSAAEQLSRWVQSIPLQQQAPPATEPAQTENAKG